jgi:hypothetical protein
MVVQVAPPEGEAKKTVEVEEMVRPLKEEAGCCQEGAEEGAYQSLDLPR